MAEKEQAASLRERKETTKEDGQEEEQWQPGGV